MRLRYIHDYGAKWSSYSVHPSPWPSVRCKEDESVPPHYLEHAEMAKHIEFEWNMDQKELRSYSLYSPDRCVWFPDHHETRNQNNIFCGWMKPNGRGRRPPHSDILYGLGLVRTHEINKNGRPLTVTVSVRDRANDVRFEAVAVIKQRRDLFRTLTLKMVGSPSPTSYNINTLKSVSLRWRIDIE